WWSFFFFDRAGLSRLEIFDSLLHLAGFILQSLIFGGQPLVFEREPLDVLLQRSDPCILLLFTGGQQQCQASKEEIKLWRIHERTKRAGSSGVPAPGLRRVNHGYFTLETSFRSCFPALNFGTRLAAIFIACFVFGLIPWRA